MSGSNPIDPSPLVFGPQARFEVTPQLSKIFRKIIPLALSINFTLRRQRIAELKTLVLLQATSTSIYSLPLDEFAPRL